MELQMKMPDVATTGSDVRILRWLINPGEAVKRGEPLLEIETDKAVSQVESIVTGMLKDIRAMPNSSVSAGQVIAILEAADAPARVAPAILQSPAGSQGTAPAAAMTRYKP